MYTDSIRVMDEVQKGSVNIKADSNIVGFGKTDFGKYGSDSFYVNIINWHKDCPFGFRLWSGKPFEEGSVKLGDFTYQASITVSVKLPDIREKCSVNFKFLPDCDFDFDCFEIKA